MRSTRALIGAALLCAADAHALHGYPTPQYCTAASVAEHTCLYPGPGVNAGLPALSARSTPAWGNTIEAIGSRLPYVQYLNARYNPAYRAVLTNMDDMMLARLSTELKAHDVV